MAKDKKEEGGDAGRRGEESELFKEQPLALPSAGLLRCREGHLSDRKGAVLHLAGCPSPEREMGKKSSTGKMQSLKGRHKGHDVAFGGSYWMLGAFVRGGHRWRVCRALSRAWSFAMENVAWKRAAPKNKSRLR